MGAKKEWCKLNGKISKGYHLHHIIPLHANGPDILENLELLSVASHAEKHRQLYISTGNIKDLYAYRILKGDFLGNASQLLLEMMTTLSQNTLKQNKSCAFYNEELRNKLNTKARQIQMDTKTNSFIHCSREKQSERGKKGGPKNKGFKYLHCGEKVLKYTVKMQKEKSIFVFLQENPEYTLGKPFKNNQHTIKQTSRRTLWI